MPNELIDEFKLIHKVSWDEPVLIFKNDFPKTNTIKIIINAQDYCQFDIPSLSSAKVTCMDLETGDQIIAKCENDTIKYWIECNA